MREIIIGYDYANYLYSQDIFGTIYANKINVVGERFNLINKIRKSIFDTFNKLFPKDEGSLIIGMLIGDTTYIPDDIINSFKKSGISHLLAVSGSNVAFIILMTKFVFDKLFGKSISKYFCIITIIVFILVSGCSLSVIRAGLMAIILIIQNIFLKRENTMFAISLSCLLILIYNPFSICDVGFILSYGGTIGIVLFNKPINKYLNNKIENFKYKKYITYIIEVLSVTLSAQIILIPIMNYYFNTVSIVSFLTNLLVSPFVGIVTIYGFIVYVIGLISINIAKYLVFPLIFLIKLVIFISNICSQIPFGNLQTPTISILGILLYYLIIFRIFAKIKRKNILNYIIIVLFSAIAFRFVIPNNYVIISMIDVSQGDSIIITTTNKKNILIDGGGSENSDYDIGEKVLVPYLLDNTAGTIDTVIVSHFHEDHAEGIISVLNNFKVNRIIIGNQPTSSYLYNELLKLAKNKDIPVYCVYSNDKLIIDDLTFTFIYPSQKTDIKNDLNNNSLIFRVDIMDTSLLFTGDAESLEEEQLLSNKLLDVDILKVGHHGSKTSSTDDFLNKITPNICLISCGVDNKFKHPHDIVLNRLKKFTDHIYRTDQCGEITLKIYKNKKILIEKIIN